MTQDPAQATGAQARPPIASDKCDFVIPVSATSQRGRAELSLGTATQRMRMDSDKCDWRVATPNLQARGPALTVTNDLQANFGAGRMRMDSDKCDWRVAVDDVANRSVKLTTTGQQLEVRTGSADVRGEMRYGKNAWAFELAGARTGMSTPPQVRARMQADKCDFAVVVELGLVGGPSVRMRAVASSKCDFRIVEFPEEPGAERRPGK